MLADNSFLVPVESLQLTLLFLSGVYLAKTILLLDAINSLLWLFNAKECFRTEQFMHPVIQESQDALKEKIAYFKQQSDDRKSKQGTQKS